MDERVITKIKNDEYDFETAADIISKILVYEMPYNHDVAYTLSLNTFDYEDDVKGAIAYTDNADKDCAFIAFDVQSFMEVFGNNVPNKHNCNFDNAHYLNTSNNYFKILEVIYHEIEHINQSIKYYSLYGNFFGDSMVLDEKFLEFAIIYFDCFLKHFSYNNSLLEHAAYVDGTYKAIKFFEKNDLEQFLKIDKFKLFMDRLLNGYTILDKELISPYDKLVKKQNGELSEKTQFTKEIIDLNIDILGYDKLLFYGLPVNYDLFMEVKNLDSLSCNSIEDLKKYIKRLK